MKHFNIAEVPLMLDVLSFVCGVKPTRDSIMVVREPVLGTASVFCQVNLLCPDRHLRTEV